MPLARDFPDSDLIGIELTGEFLARCLKRQRAMEFGGTYIHFHQRNITQLIFQENSIDTTICNSTTHELWSYGNQEPTLRRYLAEKFRQTRKFGRIIIRDVVGPDDGQQEIYIHCNDRDGAHDDPCRPCNTPEELATHINGLSTAARFERFAKEFLMDLRHAGRRGPETQLRFRREQIDGKDYVVLRLQDAVEFMLKKDYTSNWKSELNEEFAFWNFAQWKAALQQAGFAVLDHLPDGRPASRAFRNPWIVTQRLQGKVALYRKTENGLESLDYPVTNMVLIGEKR